MILAQPTAVSVRPSVHAYHFRHYLKRIKHLTKTIKTELRQLSIFFLLEPKVMTRRKKSTSPRQPPKRKPRSRWSMRTATKAVQQYNTRTESSCMCSEGHRSISRCPKFQSATMEQRMGMIHQRNLCRNFLGAAHLARQCQSKYTFVISFLVTQQSFDLG